MTNPEVQWTKDDEATLRRLWSTTPIPELSAKLRRSQYAVFFRAKQIGVFGYGQSHHWTEVADDFLRENIATMPRWKIAKELNRTPAAVIRRAREIGLVAVKKRGSEKTNWRRVIESLKSRGLANCIDIASDAGMLVGAVKQQLYRLEKRGRVRRVGTETRPGGTGGTCVMWEAT